MLSNTKCKQILNKNGIHYTDEEIVILKEAFYKMAEIMWRSHKETDKIRNLEMKEEMKPKYWRCQLIN